MAKELFITQWFSEEMRLAGERLINRLQQSGAEVALAYWELDSEEKTWTLNIISPLISVEGPKAYYRRIHDINAQSEPNEETVSLHDIRVSNIRHPIVKALQASVLYQAALENTRLGRNWIWHFYVEDMYIYRVDWEMLREPETCEQST